MRAAVCKLQVKQKTKVAAHWDGGIGNININVTA